jgi:lipoate-protein ligase B
MSTDIFNIYDLGLMDYTKALELQNRIVSAKIQNKIKQNVILLLEHPAVFTLGKKGGLKNIKVSTTFLESKNIPIIQTSRGGSITFHGPGQLIVYPIIDLNKVNIGATDFVYYLEEIMIQVSMDFGVKTSRNSKNRGIWAANKKLGSIGLSIEKGISFHGFALNVSLELDPFSWINPCGMEKVSMTSLEKELRKTKHMARIKMTEIKSRIIHHFEAFIKRILENYSFSPIITLSETTDFIGVNSL